MTIIINKPLCSSYYLFPIRVLFILKLNLLAKPMTTLTKKVILALFFITSSLYAEEPEQPLSNLEMQMLEEPQLGYISDQIYVPLRVSPCPECRIINKGLITGTKLTVLGFQEDWSLVATDRGQEGWIRSQHISNSQIARNLLDRETAKVAELNAQNKQLREDIRRTDILIKNLRNTADEAKADRAKLSQELATIKSISANELTLNEQNQKLMKHNLMLQEERDVLRTNLDDLRDNKRNESFLYGGLVAFLGAILAAIIPRVRGRKRLSEWH